ncbi:hypothetical protein ONE63_006762 [Megalurothrips usitatus]|uniref:Ig-like domain-containing protein n=1 Tax=Megalurothrips usitatus TaxID=439358 RepID=A0AAV7XQR3_9NEOP|nr:hypothetical protein ONE63_006762 [Megalurothrips usitatus]
MPPTTAAAAAVSSDTAPPPSPPPPSSPSSLSSAWPTSAPPPPPAPTAAALAAGVSYAPGAPPAGEGEVVLLATPRTPGAAPSPRGHTDSPMLNYIYDARSSAHKHMHHSQRFGPTFETNATSITVQIGSTATIDCKISLLQDNAVSWVLRKPSEDSLRLLTVGHMTYSGDTRHSVEFLYPNNWRLIVRNVTKLDEGTYECQISTHPPKLIRTHLLVNGEYLSPWGAEGRG